MISTLLRVLGLDIQKQVRAIVATVALALAGLVLIILAAGVGLNALYLWLSLEYGVFPALGILGGTAALVGIILLLVAFRSPRHQKPAMTVAEITQSATGNVAAIAQSAAQDVANAGADAIRRAPRNALFGMALTAVFVGFLVGRRS